MSTMNLSDLSILENPPTTYWLLGYRTVGVEWRITIGETGDTKRTLRRVKTHDEEGYLSLMHALRASGARLVKYAPDESPI